MLASLRARLDERPPSAELRIAAEEQRKITRLRLEKLVAHERASPPTSSTPSRGRPRRGVAVVARARDGDGRHRELGARHHRRRRPRAHADARRARRSCRAPTASRFDTGAYFAAHGIDGLLPGGEIVFTVRDRAQHYHVPLLLSPFGFSTYRGS